MSLLESRYLRLDSTLLIEEAKEMTTHFITAEINLQEDTQDLQTEIKAKLEEQGEPLRWAVTDINQEKQMATVEAIVTSNQGE